MHSENQTIVAQASATGRSGIAVLRISGKDTFKVFHKIILPDEIEKLQQRQAILLNIYRFDTEKRTKTFVDKCLVLPYVAPHSYTGEDAVDIFCHGGYVVPQLILDALIDAGARMANPGEFTQRAFLNGKLDLIQAESVEAIVSSNSQAELAFAHHHYSGQFSREIKQLRSELIDLMSLLELELDFSDEDVEFADRNEVLNRLIALKKLLSKLMNSYNRSHKVREGISGAIVGKPNVGKSSLLNLLLKKERAIVTDVPGTTRDIIEESMEISGLKFVFVDTAGIHTSSDLVEKEGIRRSRVALESASIAILLIDSNANLKKEDWELRQLVLDRKNDFKTTPVLLVNKCDLPKIVNDHELESFGKGFEKLNFSCKTGEHLDSLETVLTEAARLNIGELNTGESVLINMRQKNIITQALDAIKKSIENFQQNLSQEFISVELRHAMQYLGELIGEVSTEDILGNIFSKFCIGK
ncbi:MAG: tRNA uridine-5-carboxymethylaminomethyl(34) synthesis GTPase MnmE [bacterium]